MAIDLRDAPTAPRDCRRLVHGARIGFYCLAHRVSSPDRSPITVYRDAWAYCPHGYGSGHAWTAIEPATLAQLRMFGPRLPRRPDWGTQR